MFTLAYLAYLVLLIESVAVAILVFPYIPISVKKAFSRLLKKLFKNRHSSYIVSVLGAVFALLFIQSVFSSRAYSVKKRRSSQSLMTSIFCCCCVCLDTSSRPWCCSPSRHP